MAKKLKNSAEATGEIELKENKDKIDKYIKEKIENETKKTINIKDYKDQIDKYVKERVEIESASQSVKLLKKQLHSKKVASAIKSIIILCLLACIGYGVYYLYQDGYFDENKGVKCPVNNCTKIETEKPGDGTDVEKPAKTGISQEKLKSTYAYLLDNIKFDANSNYTSDYYNGKLTNEIKLYLSYKLIDREKITNNDDSLIFDSSDLEDAYDLLFDGNISLQSFKYNNASFVYFAAKNIYMTNTIPNPEKNISREIINITLREDDIVEISCVEGYIENGKLYNIVNNKQVKPFKESDSLVKHKDKLNVVKYVFENEDLIDITK